jgi:hypothetical protein
MSTGSYLSSATKRVKLNYSVPAHVMDNCLYCKEKMKIKKTCSSFVVWKVSGILPELFLLISCSLLIASDQQKRQSHIDSAFLFFI